MPEATKFGHQIVALADPTTGIPYSATGGGGGGGGAVTVADGADVAQGTTSDVAWVSGAGTVIALLKKIASSGASSGLTDAQLRATPVPVSGTFWQATQPVSEADGANVALGAKADAAWDGVAASASSIAILKKIFAENLLIYSVLNNSLGWLPGTAFGVSVTGQLSYGVRKDTPATYGADGTIAPFEFDNTGRLWVNSGGLTDTQLRATAVPVSGTFWQATQPISAAALPLPSGASTEATLALLQVAGGTAIGSLKSQLASAVAATSAPSYTDGTINPLSMTLAGALRVGGTVTATGPLTDTQLRASAVPVSGAFFQATQPVSIAAAVDVSDRAARLLGIVDKGKIWDGTNIAAVKAGVIAVAGDNPLVVTVHPSSAPTTAQPVTGTFFQATQPVSGTVTANQGTANTAANGWFARLTDGTSNVAVKAASTAAAAADPALVVALSPNQNTLALALLTKITDGTNTGAVKAASTAAVAADPAQVVALSPNNNTGPNALFVRPRQVATYAAGYRKVSATAGATALVATFVANTNAQLATVHHLVGSTKTVRIKKVSINYSNSGAGFIQFGLNRLSATTAPATGNPAITPAAFDSSDGAAEAVCLAGPTTAGSLTGVDQALSPDFSTNGAASAAQSDPARAQQELVLFDSRSGTGVGKDITLRAGVAEGLVVMGRATAAITINYTIYIEFTEE